MTSGTLCPPQECRNLRNFSSLYAIISALQSSPVHRLKRTWDEISRCKIVGFGEGGRSCHGVGVHSLPVLSPYPQGGSAQL